MKIHNLFIFLLLILNNINNNLEFKKIQRIKT